MKARLTKRTIEAIPVGDRDVKVWDSEIAGYGVKVTPRGARVYVVKYRINGRQRWYTIGRHGAPWTPEKARREAIRVLGEVANDRDPASAKAEQKTASTVGALCTLYLAEGCDTKKPSTLATDRGRIERHIKPLLGHMPVKNVTRADVERFQRDVAAGRTAGDVKTGPHGRAIVRGGKGTAARTVGLLGGIFSFAIARQMRPDNPVRGVKRFKDARNERFLSSEELARLGDALADAEERGTESFSTITALRLLVLTGARKSEILTARWQDVDHEHRCLRLVDSKTGPKVIPLGAAALEVLTNAPRVEGNPYICPGDKPEAAFVGLQKAWVRLRDLAKLPDVRLHDLRHSFASVGASGGVSLVVLGALLGHRSPATTARYSHLSASPVQTAADRISRQIDAAMRRKAGGEVVKLGSKG